MSVDDEHPDIFLRVEGEGDRKHYEPVQVLGQIDPHFVTHDDFKAAARKLAQCKGDLLTNVSAIFGETLTNDDIESVRDTAKSIDTLPPSFNTLRICQTDLLKQAIVDACTKEDDATTRLYMLLLLFTAPKKDALAKLVEYDALPFQIFVLDLV